MTIPPESSWNLPPTDTQIRCIAKYCIYNHIWPPLEHRPSNRWEARDLIYRLRLQAKSRPKGKSKSRRK